MRQCLAASLLVIASLWASCANAQNVQYRGYTIDTKGLAGNPQAASIIQSVRKQIDITEDVGLKPDTLQFFRSIPIRFSPALKDSGRWSSEGLDLWTQPIDPERPILLHEFLHAYHFGKVPNGFRNAEIEEFYEVAKKRGIYPADAYVLKNSHEFFAVTASVFLYGKVARPPNTRAEFRQKQPKYYQYLEKLFGVSPS